jgi:hypothetical protein
MVCTQILLVQLMHEISNMVKFISLNLKTTLNLGENHTIYMYMEEKMLKGVLVITFTDASNKVWE